MTILTALAKWDMAKEKVIIANKSVINHIPHANMDTVNPQGG